MKKRLQRLLSGLLAAALLWALPVSAGAAGRFADVPESHWAAEEIGRAVDLGLFQGETATRFGVGHKMTRAAFAVVLCRFFGWELVNPAQGTYTDVQDTGAWYYSAVETACANGAVTRQSSLFRPSDPITREEMARKIDETLRLGGTQILLQGGHHPDLPLEWYEDLLRWMRATWPSLHIHAFSPPEIFFWSQKFGLSVDEVISRLKAAGLDSIPGGGAEILQNDVRAQVSPNKCSADQWLYVMERAHNLGMRTTATMMFGHEEEPRHRLDHLFAVREVQDRTHGFTAFIPWTFQPAHTRINVTAPLPAPAYLRLLAVSRLVLDNIPNIQSSWVTMGPEVAQLALFYGANDFGSLMIEENVVAAAGVSYHLTRHEIHKIIRAAGFTPVQRTMNYTPVDPQLED